MSGTETISRFRNRPSERSAATGSTGARRGAGDGGAVVREALGGGVRREQHRLVVAAALALAAVERRAAADRHERVLERRPARVVRVRVAGDDRVDAKRLGEVAQEGV